MRVTHFLAASGLLAALTVAAPATAQDAASAPAQDAAGMAPPMAQDAPQAPVDRYDYNRPFTGLYVGVSGGYDVQSNDLGSRINFDRNGDGTPDQVLSSTGTNVFSPGFCNGKARGATVSANGGCENDRNRGSYYGRVGYDRQLGPVIVGALGEFGRTDIVDYVSAFSTTPNYYIMSRKIDWEASGRLRVGLQQGRGLFYATGGVGYARITHGFATSNTTNAFSIIQNDRDKFGYVVGGGAEVRIFGPFTFGLEYTYHDYKDGLYKVYATRGNAAATNSFVLPPYTAGTVFQRSDDNFRWHSLRAVAGFHF